MEKRVRGRADGEGELASQRNNKARDFTHLFFSINLHFLVYLLKVYLPWLKLYRVVHLLG